jgi:hypothetical protein
VGLRVFHLLKPSSTRPSGTGVKLSGNKGDNWSVPETRSEHEIFPAWRGTYEMVPPATRPTSTAQEMRRKSMMRMERRCDFVQVLSPR